MNKFTLGIVAAVFSASVNASWSIMDISGLNGNSFYASSINDSGQIAGSFNDNNTSLWHAFIFDVNSASIKDIGSVNDTYATSGQINNSGQVIVQYSNAYSSGYYIADSNGNRTELNTISAINGHPSALNDSGVLAGNYLSSNNDIRSFITGNNINFIKDIGTLGGSVTAVTAINNSGEVVGYSLNSNNKGRAFVTSEDGSGIRDLGVLDKKYYESSAAYDVNESGQVIGTSSMGNGDWTHAFVTGENGEGMINLGTLGGRSSHAVAINDAGIVVGWASNSVGIGDNHSFIYANGGLTDLSILPEVINAGWSDIFVTDINNNGQIIGWGYLENDPGNRHAFMLSFTSDTVFTPQDLFIPNIPEPSTYLMLLAGLGFLGFVGRRKIQDNSQLDRI